MPYIIIVVMVFAVAFVVAVLAVIEVNLGNQYRSRYINLDGNPNDTFKWIEGISLDGFPVPADYESSTYFSIEFLHDSEENEHFHVEARRSMSRSRWDRAWDDERYERNLACKFRKPHPARASKARK